MIMGFLLRYSELEGKDFPKVGESALVYGERLRNEARFKENQPESQQDNQEISIFENDIGTTLYNNAIVSSYSLLLWLIFNLFIIEL